MAKRSIGSSISASISAVAETVELLPAGIKRTGNVLGMSGDVAELYLQNWVQEKKTSNREDKVERIARLEKLRLSSVNAGITSANNIKEFIAEIDAMDV